MAISDEHDSDSVVLKQSLDLLTSISNLRCIDAVENPAIDYEAQTTPLMGAEESSETESTTSHHDDGDYNDDAHHTTAAPVRYESNFSTKDSLARAITTPRILSLFIPILAILAHALFFYGQTAPMWRLRLSQHVDAWANATTTESRLACDTLGIPYRNQFYIQDDMDVETFTYGYAVRQLWKAKGMPGKILPRIAAVLLTLFSGVWPHLKLILVNVTWLASWCNPASRTQALRWLSTLGKWSLADVLAVCVMVGVLNLDWQVDPGAMKVGIMAELPAIIELTKGMYKPVELCSLLLKYKCDRHTPIEKKVKCGACQSLVSQAYNHPSWAQGTGKEIVKGVTTSGGGEVKLRVVGMRGIYAFCLAVVLSIVLSLLVDVFDHKAKRAREKQEEQALLRGSMPRHESEESQTMRSMELEGGSENAVAVLGPTTRPQLRLSWRYICLLLGALVTAVVVFFAIITPCMERRVDGAIPMLLHRILGVAWEHTYSLRGLVITTGAAGAWDLLLMRTFNLFVVFGPMFRALICVFGLSVPLPRVMRKVVFMTMDFVGAFCAWEVFVIAMFMVDMLMPSITDTIYNNPSCAQVSENGSCLKVEFNILKSFALLVVGGMLLLVVSGLGVSQGLKEEVQYRTLLVGSYSSYVEVNVEEEESHYVRLESEESILVGEGNLVHDESE